MIIPLRHVLPRVLSGLPRGSGGLPSDAPLRGLAPDGVYRAAGGAPTRRARQLSLPARAGLPQSCARARPGEVVARLSRWFRGARCAQQGETVAVWRCHVAMQLSVPPLRLSELRCIRRGRHIRPVERDRRDHRRVHCRSVQESLGRERSGVRRQAVYRRAAVRRLRGWTRRVQPSYSCGYLPPGCTECSCAEVALGCDCVASGGRVTVTCYAP
jgi:hypothetical protein